MTIEEKLKILICEKYESQRNFCRQVGMPPSTLNIILKRGVNNASIQNVIKICQALEISTDELAEGRIIPNDHKQRQALRILAYARELNKVIQLGREYKNAYEPYCIDGVEMSDEETEMLMDGLEIITNLIRKQRLRREMQLRFEDQQRNVADGREMEF